MGSPDFALPTLSRLLEHYQVVGVVSQPDRPSGRGQLMAPPPVKKLAVEAGIEVIQPNRLREPGVLVKLISWQPDVIVVAAFGQILRANVLEMPKYGCVNVHGSLLPRWRGAAPIQACLLAGDEATGVTIMKMDEGVDTGDMLAQLRIGIKESDNAGTLTERMAELGAALLIETLPRYFAGDLKPLKQEDQVATRALMISKEDGALDPDLPAEMLHNKVRAYNPWPGVSYSWVGGLLKIHSSKAQPADSVIPGQRGVVNGFPAIGTPTGWLLLLEVQPANKKKMSGAAYLAGARNWLSAEINN